jgi:hypothetical protein
MPLFLIHAGLMATGFLFVLSALIVAMTQRRERWWLKIHRAIGLTGSSLMLLGAITAIAAVASTTEARHLRTPHTWLGVLTVAAAIVTPTLGLLQFRIPQKSAVIRLAHRLSGRLLNLMTPFTILLGLLVAEII